MTSKSYRRAWQNRPAHEMNLSLEEWTSGRQFEPEVRAALTSRRPQHTPGKMNGLEKRYAQHLEMRRMVGEIKAWKFEPLKFKLAPATFYNPDFLITNLDKSLEIHETKGHWEDDSRVKIKVAAAMFPEFEFVGVMWNRAMKDWKFEHFRSEQ